jgi:membrane protease YdiL (CAAX protease family)
MTTWTKRDFLIYAALFILLAVRMPVADLFFNFEQLFNTSVLSMWDENLRLIQNWTYYLYERWSFVLVGIVILINRIDLKSLNIDEYFLYIFWCSGVIYCIYFFWPLGWAAALISIYLFIFYYKNWDKFVNKEPKKLQIVAIILIGFFLSLLFISDSVDVTKIRLAVHWSIIRMPFVVVEEVIFRGLLWKFLITLGWSESKIVILQAILFWISHVYHMFTYPVLFWVIIPIISILFGIFVWKSRSITPSTIAHILFNFFRWLTQS